MDWKYVRKAWVRIPEKEKKISETYHSLPIILITPDDDLVQTAV